MTPMPSPPLHTSTYAAIATPNKPRLTWILEDPEKAKGQNLAKNMTRNDGR